MTLKEGDPLRQSIKGQVYPTNTILIRIKKKKSDNLPSNASSASSSSSSSSNSLNNQSISVEVLGVVYETFKFLKPSDLQFLPETISSSQTKSPSDQGKILVKQ
jgi:hypothetical protein